MGVIQSIWPWRVYCFLDEDGKNVILRWIGRESIGLTDQQILWDRLALLEQVGPNALPGCVQPLEGEFHCLDVRARKNARAMNPVFCYGPFAGTELTILAGAPIEDGVLGPMDVLPIARRNLAALKKDWRRRVWYEKRTA